MIAPPRYGSTVKLSGPERIKAPLIDVTTHAGPGGQECYHTAEIRGQITRPSRNCLLVAHIAWGDETFKDEVEVDCARGALVCVPAGRMSVDVFLEPPFGVANPTDEAELSARIWAGADRTRRNTRTRNLNTMPTGTSIDVAIPRFAQSAEALVMPGVSTQITLQMIGDGAIAIATSSTGSITIPGLGDILRVTNGTGPAKAVLVVFTLSI